MKTRIYFACTDILNDDAIFEKAMREAGSARREKAEKLRLRKDKNLSLGAEILLKKALSDSGYDIEKMIISFKENGKPYFADHPEISFNLSHTANTVMCAVSDREIGCDIEKIRDVNLKIADRFFSEEERDFIKSHKSKGEKNEAFFRLWTLKESFIKVTGKGLKTPLGSFSVITQGNIRLTQGEICSKFYLHEVTAPDGTKAAYCIKDADDAAEVFDIDISRMI